MKSYPQLFNIDKNYTAINHGSFGACTREVLNYHIALQKRMESLTTRFFSLELKPLLTESLQYLAGFINAPVDNLVFIRNATTAANAVINSLTFRPGDEIVTNNLIYESCRHLLNHLAVDKGVVLRIAKIPFPACKSEEIVAKHMELVNNKTRLVFIDHITSETATILPVEKISRELKAYGIPIFIDGAHAPGMIPLDLNIIAPDYYTGNCHKWLSSPKGAAFLYVDPARQENMIPSIISNFFRKGDNVREKFYNSFFWSGTAIDYLSCCAVKPAIKHLAESVEGGWPEIMKRNHELVIKGRDILREMLDLEIFTPEEMTGSMVTFLLNSRGEKDPLIGIDKLLLSLFEKYKIESFITNLYNTDRRILRISAHLYNREEDYARLGTALKEIL